VDSSELHRFEVLLKACWQTFDSAAQLLQAASFALARVVVVGSGGHPSACSEGEHAYLTSLAGNHTAGGRIT